MDADLVELLRAEPIRLGEGSAGKAADTRAPVQIADIRDDTLYDVSRLRGPLGRHGYRALLSVPLFLEQRVLGALTVWRRQPGSFTPEVVNLLQTFATHSALALQNARLFQELADKSPARAGEPAQVALPRQHEPRVANALERNPRIQRDDARRALW
jgi:GAF domain-containing protein